VLDGSFGEELDRVVLSALTGATVVQVVSALLRHSPKQLGLLRDGLAMWAG
jgi:dihydroorotate dehydrogenase